MYQVAFLDLCVFRNVDGHLHRIGWKPFVKESACHLPLHQSSCHAPAIHRSWLRAEVSRMHLRSQHMTSFHHFKELKLQRWEYFFLCPNLIDACRRWIPPFRTLRSDVTKPNQPTSSIVVRIVVSYHPALSRLPMCLASITRKWNPFFQRTWNVQFVVQVVWSKASVPLHVILRHLKC